MKPYNNNVLLEKQTTEAASDSGIILPSKDETIFILTTGHDELKGKQVFMDAPPVLVRGDIYATPIDNIIAYAS